MPYIKSSEYDKAAFDPENPGQLNYAITMLLIDYLDKKTESGKKGLRYEILNEVIGALECAKQEFLRQVVNPFEDRAIERNEGLYNV